MDIITVIIQAVVQGLTEFLPVSSSGHLSVVQHVTGVNGEAALVLSLVLHLGTLAAVFVAFWGTIWGMIKEFFLTIGDIFTGKFSWKNMNGNRRMMFMVIIATVILVPFYLVEGFFTGRQGDGDIVFEGAAFLFTSLILFLSDRFGHGTRTAEQMTVKDAVTVGLFQVVALSRVFPGAAPQRRADCSPVLKRRSRSHSRLYSGYPRYSAEASWNSATRCILTWSSIGSLSE